METLDFVETGQADRIVTQKPLSIRGLISAWLRNNHRAPETALPWGQRELNLYRPGYPLYTSLLGKQSEFQIFRKFRNVRMRLLLVKQDRVAQLEEELKKIDTAERKELFLGNSRRDRNPERKSVLEQLDQALIDYDGFLQRTHFSLHQPKPSRKHVEMLQSWLESTGSIARTETAYLSPEDYWDLFNLGPLSEQDFPALYQYIERLLFFLTSGLNKMISNSSENDTNVIAISRPKIRALNKSAIASFTIILLLVPIVALNAVSTTLGRLIIIFISASLFVSLLTLASPASMPEILAAGAAYAAVLVVFVSGNGIAAQ